MATTLQDDIQKLASKGRITAYPYICRKNLYKYYYDIYIPMPVLLLENEVLQYIWRWVVMQSFSQFFAINICLLLIFKDRVNESTEYKWPL